MTSGIPGPNNPQTKVSSKTHPALKPVLGSIALACIVITVILLPIQSILSQTLENFRTLGPWGPILFIAIYAIACIAFVPGSLITLAGGAIYGPVWGVLYVSAGSTLGATACFLIGRFLARDWIARKLTQHQGMQRLDQAVAHDGWKIVGLTRLSPIFPFSLLNYAYGLTRVSLRHYVLASWIGMLPGTILYVYIGSVAGELSTLSTMERTRTPLEWTFYGIGLLATLAVTLYITRLARSALSRHLPTATDTTQPSLAPKNHNSRPDIPPPPSPANSPTLPTNNPPI